MNSPLHTRILEEFRAKFVSVHEDGDYIDCYAQQAEKWLSSTITQVEAETLGRVLEIIDAVYIERPHSEEQVVPYEIKKIVAKEVCSVLREKIEALRQTK